MEIEKHIKKKKGIKVNGYFLEFVNLERSC